MSTLICRVIAAPIGIALAVILVFSWCIALVVSACQYGNPRGF